MMRRRDFLKTAATFTGAALTSSVVSGCAAMLQKTEVGAQPSPEMMATSEGHPSTSTPEPTSTDIPNPLGERPMKRVVLVKTDDRAGGVRRAIDLLEYDPFKEKSLFIKPNFNSADPSPGSTHNDTLQATISNLLERGASSITVGDRSGMGDTDWVMRQKDIFRMGEELGFETIVFDQLARDDWIAPDTSGSHWRRGFSLPRPMLEADGIVQTCCLKTHRYGGHFTMSLKNSVGMVAKSLPGDGYNYMNELHRSSHQRKMIAEINTAYDPELVILDGMEAFTHGGPAIGTLVNPGVILAGVDRVAIDAVGVAILRYFGTTSEVANGPIFDLEQIARAVELGLGVQTPDEIEFVTDDAESSEFSKKIRDILVSA